MCFKPIPRQKPYNTDYHFKKFLIMLRNGNLIEGEDIRCFEGLFSEMFGAKHALSVSSCRSAFSLIIDVLNIAEGDEVILPALNLPAFPKILKFKGINPVFVDIDSETLNIDTKKIEESITSKTKAIVAVHLFGNVCHMREIMTIAKKYNVPVIEDCANAFGGKYMKEYVGTYGDVACFSLGDSKDVPTFGGGILITNNDALFKRIEYMYEDKFTVPRLADLVKGILKSLMLRLMTSKIFFLLIVYPWVLAFSFLGIDIIGCFIEEKDKMIKSIPRKRLSNFQASIGMQIFDQYKARQVRRLANSMYYNEKLSGQGSLELSKVTSGGDHTYWNYVILSQKRMRLAKSLLLRGIDSKKVYNYDCNNLEIFREFKKHCPESEKTANRLLALPNYHFLSEDEISFICQRVISGLDSKNATSD